MQNPTDYIIPIIILAIGIGIRIKRSFNFHKYRHIVPLVRITVCACILFVVFSFGIMYHPDTIIIDGIGIVLGLGLAYLGVRYAIIEKRNDGIYYRTHEWIEIAILVIFFIRLSIRFYQLYGTIGTLPPEEVAGQLRYEKDPATGIIISVFSTYYICYFTYIAIRVSKISKLANI